MITAEKMHQFKAMVEITLKFRVPVKGGFNHNYKCGREVAEQFAIDEHYDDIPMRWFKEMEPIVDAECIEYELVGHEAEEADDDR